MNFQVGQRVCINVDDYSNRRSDVQDGTVEEVIDAEDGLCFIKLDDGNHVYAAPYEQFGCLVPAEPEYSI